MKRFILCLLTIFLYSCGPAWADLTLTAGEGIDVSSAGAGLDATVACEDASSSNKGCASFNASQFSVTGGAVSLGTVDISDDTNLTAGTGITITGDTVSVQNIYESSSSNNIDPDRLAGDSTDDNLIDQEIIQDVFVLAAGDTMSGTLYVPAAGLKVDSTDVCLQDGTNCPASGGGDAVTVNSSGADTTANFLTNLYYAWTLTDGGAGGPDDITIKPAYSATLAGNPALLAGESVFSSTGIIFEGSTADTVEGLLTVTDPSSTDKTWTLPNASGTILLGPGSNGMVARTSAGVSTNRTLSAGSNGGISIANGDGVSGNPTFTISISSALSGDHSMTAHGAKFGQSGIVFEGATADTVEAYFVITDPTSSDKTYTFPNASGTVILSSSTVDALAASTSAQLRTLLSDETGTGAAVFAGGDIAAGTATTPAADDSDTSIATTAYVQSEIDGAGGTGLSCSSGICNVIDNYLLNTSDSWSGTLTTVGTLDISGGKIRITAGTDPTAFEPCTAGQIFMDTDATSGQQFMGCESGSFVKQGDGTGAGSGAFSDAADPVVLNTTTKDVVVGASQINSGKFSVDGDADQVQLAIQGHSSQTSNLVELENSGGTIQVSISNLGNVTANQFTLGDSEAVQWPNITLAEDSGTLLLSGGGMRIVDDQNLYFGTSSTWSINYDNSVDDQLLFETAKTATQSITDPLVEFLVDTGAAGMTADQEVFGIAKGSQASNTPLFTLDEDGDATFAGSITAGGATSSIVLASGGSFQDASNSNILLGSTTTLDVGTQGTLLIEVGTGVDPDVAGKIGIDTTDDQFVYYGGAKRVLSYMKEVCVTLEDPVDADDDVPFFIPRDAITITDVACQVTGGTSIPLTISDGTNALEAITCGTSVTEDDGSITNGTFTSLEPMQFDLGSPSGSPTWLNFCVTYTIDAQ